MRRWEQFLKENVGKKAILVEGKYDYDPFAHFFSKKSPDWERYFVIVAAGNKRSVLEKLKNNSVAFGIVDRDTWGEKEIKKAGKENSEKLFVLPRYCLENYIIIPDEIKPVLPADKQDSINFDTLFANVGKWKAHAALWRAVTSLYSGLISLDFNNALLPKTVDTIPSDESIMNKLSEWNKVLNPDETFEKFKKEEEQFLKMNDIEFVKYHVHGKHFFDNEMLPVLQKKMGNVSKNNLFKYIVPPVELNKIFDRLIDH
ncbi:MAG TPA: DUF4435 domain-containing protein [bacterium]|nr:DUF4435 domain-containing protein [bacterium]